MNPKGKICVGLITGPHGVRGLVRLRSFTEDPWSIFDYKPLTDDTGEQIFQLTCKNVMQDHYLISVKGITTREDAEKIRGVKLYISRDILPDPEEGIFYHADLIGLDVVDANEKSFGKVIAVHDYGAGTFLEIGQSKKDSFMLPFKDVFVPEVALNDGHIRIDLPVGWLDKEESPSEEN